MFSYSFSEHVSLDQNMIIHRALRMSECECHRTQKYVQYIMYIYILHAIHICRGNFRLKNLEDIFPRMWYAKSSVADYVNLEKTFGR